MAYSKKLAEIKKSALPFFPLGFTGFSKDTVACGLQTTENGKRKVYLAVWVLRGNTTATVPVQDGVKAAVAYPAGLPTDFSLTDGVLTVDFPETQSARFFEIELRA